MERIRADIQKFASDLLQKLSPEEAVIFSWPLVCGPNVARRTKAVAFLSGKLRIQVLDNSWCRQLSDFSAQYIAAIHAIVKSKALQQIEYVQTETSFGSLEEE